MGECQFDGTVDIVLTAEECRSIIAALRSAYIPGAPFYRWALADRIADAIDDAAYHAELRPDVDPDRTPSTGWPYPVPAVLWDAVTDAEKAERDGGFIPDGWIPDRTVAIPAAQRGYVDGAAGRIADPGLGSGDPVGTEIAYWAGYNLALDHAAEAGQ